MKVTVDGPFDNGLLTVCIGQYRGVVEFCEVGEDGAGDLMR